MAVTLEGYGLHVPVVPISNGVDTEFFKKEEAQRERFRRRYGFDDRDKIVLCVGLPIERKGLLDVISLAEMFPQYRFFWCGHMDKYLLPAHIRHAMKNAPVNLQFPGFLNREELRDAYGGSDLFLFPTKEETEGIVMLEALAMEIPVLVRDIPVYDGWLSDGVQVRKARDLAEFGHALCDILENGCSTMTRLGRCVAEERNLESIGRRLAQCYQTVLN